jgi:asparagine synthase (glutamine-hydrolysing)
MSNEDGNVHVVFNGEIYNHRPLRERLVSQGHSFKTHADTEVLVHLYEEYGDDGVHLLRGMFAYALWDARRRRLLVVRDRLGIKPLYYTQAGPDVVFASEVKALLRHPGVVAEPDFEALDLYLTFQYVPGERTLFRGIRKLPPGHLMVVEDGRLTTRRYWDIVFGEGRRGIELDEVAEEFSQLFADTVNLHMISDVPVGALLSGGIDSSAVVAMMARGSGRSVETFTVGFDMPGMRNELDDARMVAREFGTKHHEIVVRPDAAEILPKLVWHMDEPVADPAALPTFLLCQFARQTVPVVLTGEGGDELLAGYPRYAWFMMAKRLQRSLSPALRERVLLPLTRSLPFGRRYHKAFEDVLAERDDVERHLRWIANLTPELKARLVAARARPATRGGPEAAVRAYLSGNGSAADELVHGLISVDIHTWLVDDILTKMDKMSMATSVEARVPFLDHRLVEFLAALPVSVKTRTLGTKRLLRESMRGVLPQHTLGRRKYPFSVPVNSWLRGPLRGLLGDVLLTSRARERGWLEHAELERMVTAQASGDDGYGQPLWNLLCLELWARAFLDGEGNRWAA